MAGETGSPHQDDISKPLGQSAEREEASEDAAAETMPEGAADSGRIDALLESVAGAGADATADAGASTTESEPADAASQAVAQEKTQQLLREAGQTGSATGQPGKPRRQDPLAAEGDVPEADIEFLLGQAQEALDSVQSPSGAPSPAGVKSFRLPEFGGTAANTETATLDLIRDVELDVRIELGRTHMYLEDVLKLCKGSVVPLDKLAGDPVDVYVNGRLIARGEVLVLNDNFCVRVAELIAAATET
jgi:flagellar motor switch protein FliN/FliY